MTNFLFWCQFGKIANMSKILSTSELQDAVNLWESRGDRVVLATGVFDILHPGHTNMLKRAKTYGDVLLVGINTDSSVKRLKGQDRPHYAGWYRMQALSALVYIDAVCEFEENTPEQLIHIVRPHAYVKGGDYKPSDLSETEAVHANNGAVIILPRDPRYSSTELIKQRYPIR